MTSFTEVVVVLVCIGLIIAYCVAAPADRDL